MNLKEVYGRLGISDERFRDIELNLGLLKAEYSNPADVIAAAVFPNGAIAKYSTVEIAFMLYLYGLTDGEKLMKDNGSENPIDVDEPLNHLNTGGEINSNWDPETALRKQQ